MKIPKIHVIHEQLMPIPDEEGYVSIPYEEYLIQFPTKEVFSYVQQLRADYKYIDELKHHMRSALLMDADKKFPGELFKVVEQPEQPGDTKEFRRLEFKLYVYEMNLDKIEPGRHTENSFNYPRCLRKRVERFLNSSCLRKRVERLLNSSR